MTGEWDEAEARRAVGEAVAALPADAKTVPRRGRGRPEIPSAEWKGMILDEVADGNTLVEVCDKPGWPSRRTVYRWLEADPDFWRSYHTRARVMMADAIAERALRDARTATDAPLGTLAWRASCWFAAKMNPDRYGDRVNLRRDDRPVDEMTDGELGAIAAGSSAGIAGPEAGEG